MKRRNKKYRLIRDAWIYLKASQGFVLASFLIFVVSAIAGFILVEHLSFFDNLLADIFAKVENLSGLPLIAFIFYNNVLSAFFGLFFGVFFGIFSFFNLLLNGTLVGYVLARAAETRGLGLAWRLVPHGIFELPAIFIATGLGMRLGMSFFSPNWKKTLKERLLASIGVFLVIVVPLLIAAAFIEGILITLSG
ncbi:MAG TPA: stage II sporulation protein M [Candidatus Nanoarchaeia archaeon]|nr:stage II sporulation protein M [Candidatus Nanoarchaeia archaeon]